MLIRDAAVDGRRVDVFIRDATIVAVTPAASVGGARHRTTGDAASDDDVLDAAGGALLPGLHDHHVHLLAMAAAARSVVAGPPHVIDAAGLAAALHRADRALGPGEWLRAVGYHESVAGDLDRRRLDALGLRHPVRVQHRTGMMWVLDSRALATVGALDDPAAPVERDGTGEPTGQIVRADDWLRARLAATSGTAGPPDLAAVGRDLAAFGITGVTDMTPASDPAELEPIAAAVRGGSLALDVIVTGAPALPRTAGPGLPRGPVKVVLDDHDLPPFDRLVATVVVAHAAGRNVAVHSVTRTSLALALAAWEEAGARPGDRIEHGALIPVEAIPVLRELGLTVVTQPSFVRERGDAYLADVEAGDAAHLWRCGSLVAGGVAVALGSDAPYGPPDPWQAVRSATERRTAAGAVLGGGERVGAATALAGYLGRPDRPGDHGALRCVAPGAPADLCLLDRPLAEQLRAPAASAVVATIRRGRAVHLR